MNCICNAVCTNHRVTIDTISKRKETGFVPVCCITTGDSMHVIQIGLITLATKSPTCPTGSI